MTGRVVRAVAVAVAGAAAVEVARYGARVAPSVRREVKSRRRVTWQALRGLPVVSRVHTGPLRFASGSHHLLIDGCTVDGSLDDAPDRAREAFEDLVPEFLERLERRVRGGSVGVTLDGMEA